ILLIVRALSLFVCFSLHDALPICGYFAYQWFAIEKPVKRAIHATPHVTLKELRVDPDRIEIRLSADEKFSLAADYLPLRKKLDRSEEHTSELQSRENLVCRLLLEK